MNHEAAKIFFLNDLQHTFADNKKKREFLIHDDALHARFMTRFNIIWRMLKMLWESRAEVGFKDGAGKLYAMFNVIIERNDAP